MEARLGPVAEALEAAEPDGEGEAAEGCVAGGRAAGVLGHGGAAPGLRGPRHRETWARIGPWDEARRNRCRFGSTTANFPVPRGELPSDPFA